MDSALSKERHKSQRQVLKALTMPESGQRIVQEMVRVVFARMYTRKHYRNASKKAVLKILFKAKQCLPDSNPIKDALPYYWYKDGPYSSLIYKTIDHLQADGMIAPSSSTYQTYLFDRDRINIPLSQSDEHMDEAKAAVADVVDGFTHIEALVGDIYRTAPYRWYDTYNLKFKVRFNNFCDKMSTNNNSGGYTRKDILHALDDAVIDFPQFPDFPELRRTFMRFARLLNSFLRTDDCMEHKEMFPIFKKISNSVWDVFAYGVRIEYHDDYYDEEIDRWVERYKEEIATLDEYIRRQQSKIEQVSTYEVKLASHVTDMKRHPEKYEFTKMNLDHIIN